MQWARADEMVAQRGARPNPSPKLLEKTRSPHPRNRIRDWLPSKYPAGHRKAQSRITQMHEPHRNPQPQIKRSPQGRISITIGKIAALCGFHKAHPCHQGGTEVIGKERPLPSGWLGAGAAYVSKVQSKVQKNLDLIAVEAQCASFVSTSPLCPAGGTTIVERLLADASFRRASRSVVCNRCQRSSSSALCFFNFSN